MTLSLFPHPFADREADAHAAEAFETDRWTALGIFDCELFTHRILDPCCGHGTLSEIAKARGHDVIANDLYDWGYGQRAVNFLDYKIPDPENITVLMNPPFSLAVPFVEHGLRQRVRKLVSFQRFSWFESGDRDPFWNLHPPARVHCCIDRANCWRFDIPPEDRTSSTPTTHAWFVWERGHPGSAVLGRMRKE